MLQIRLLDVNFTRIQLAAKLFEQEMLARKLEGRVASVPEHLEVCRKGHTMDNTAVEVNGQIVCKGIFSTPKSVTHFFDGYFARYGNESVV